jgi:hypothetical protein
LIRDGENCYTVDVITGCKGVCDYRAVEMSIDGDEVESKYLEVLQKRWKKAEMEVGSTSHISSTDSNYERPAMGTSSTRGRKSIRFMQTVQDKWEEAGGCDLKDPGSCSETVNKRGQMTGKRTYSFGACNYDGQVGKHMHPAESS